MTWQWTPPKIESSWLDSGVGVSNSGRHGWRGFIHSQVQFGFKGKGVGRAQGSDSVVVVVPICCSETVPILLYLDVN
jgi:hypothetical protein